MKKRIITSLLNGMNKRAPFQNEMERQKIEYILTVIYNEVSKMLLLSLYYILLRWWLAYIISFLVVLLSRSNAGGIHEKSYFRCLLHSFLFFEAVRILSGLEWMKKLACILVVFTMGLYALYAPIVSGARGQISSKRRIKMKRRSIGYTAAIGICEVIFGVVPIITATLLLLDAEYMFLIRMRQKTSVGKCV